MNDAWVLPQIPQEQEIGALLGELMEEIHRANRRNGGGLSYAYNNGKWVELSRFDGTRKEVILEKDTRISKEAIEAAIETVKNI